MRSFDAEPVDQFRSKPQPSRITPMDPAISRDRLVALRQDAPGQEVCGGGGGHADLRRLLRCGGCPRTSVSNRSTLTGSIGVIRDGWGFDKLINRLGIERRIFTAGTSKRSAGLVPAAEIQRRAQGGRTAECRARAIQGRGPRGPRSATSRRGADALFRAISGPVIKPVKFGLVDAVCTLSSVLEHEYGVEDVKDYTLPPSLWTASRVRSACM